MDGGHVTQAATLPAALAEILSETLPLQDGLDAYEAALRRLDPAFATAYDALVERLRNAGVGGGAPVVGGRMPPFLLPDQDGKLRALEDMTETGPVIVSFNRGHWCPFCRIELDALARSAERLSSLGATIVSVMPERSAFTAVAKRRDIPFPILSDVDHAYALSLGLAFWIGDDLVALMKRGNRDLAEYQGNDGWCLAVPATFVVGRDGFIKARLVDPDFRRRRMNVADIAGALERELSAPANP